MSGLKRRAPPTVLEDTAGPETASEPKREDPVVLAAKLMGGAASLPTTTAPKPVPPAPARREPSLQINFRVTPKLARLLHDEQAAAGGIGVRCFVARVLKEAGYDVPEEDLEPRFNRRDYSTIGN